ncbi:hypothetical protein TSUD_410220 [Trifolium subterraneum]|uniref:Uncharacterized protein n=1 Tax=Trifolium subterraneum TaxID=3900 RepID=A0A2Z6P2C1_TRISU|nr:hypothetical protein TSUD_410220 [Trifolium subterraneum]
MRGRESSAAHRAFPGWPSRSSPSPEVRHKREGVSVDSGEWTEVRHRRRKALREADETDDRLWQKPVTHSHQGRRAITTTIGRTMCVSTEGGAASSVDKIIKSTTSVCFLFQGISSRQCSQAMDGSSKGITLNEEDRKSRRSVGVASFERNDTRADGRPEKEKVGLLKGPVGALKKEDFQHPTRQVERAGDGGRTKLTMSKIESDKKGPGPLEGVQVGDIVVKLGARKEHVVRNEGQRKGDGQRSKDLDTLDVATQEKESSILLRKYQTKSDDVQWAHNGLVATIINGEAIHVVQNRITDAGFNDIVITPMGADKVFVRSSEGVDVLSIVSNAEEFFKLVFSNWVCWDKDVSPYHRGAWVRLYGVPLHAWNVNFFKLCVLDCGRFLRVDNCSADRDKLDFARVLIATPNLDIIKREERVLVDGVVVEIKIVEEWGYALGEDTCLFEEENATEASQSDYGLEEAANNSFHGKSDVELSEKQEGNMSGEGESEGEGERTVDVLSPVCDQVEVKSTSKLDPQGEATSQQSETQECLTTRRSYGESRRDAGNQMHNDRANSCPPAASRTAISGPWSLEWLQDHDHGEAGVIFSAQKRDKEGGRRRIAPPPVSQALFVDGRVLIARSPRVAKLLEKVLLRRIPLTMIGRTGWLCKEMTRWSWMMLGGSIISWNIRGLGGLEEQKEVRKLVGDLSPVILCLQETNLQTCDDFLCSTLWGNSPHSFSFRPSIGASGGLLIIWDTSEVEVWSTESREHVMWCHGRFTKYGEEFYVVNVYASCDDGAKQGLWDSLSARIQSLGRRRFTWFKGDGLSMSRLDRFLLSEEWCLAWPNCKQTARLRGFSDHCSLVLSANEEDWGPRPSRMLKCWRDVPGYQLFVKDRWKSIQVDGWGGYVLKEKLKMIKAALKDWHTTHAQNLPSRIESLKVRLSTLDQKGEEEVLSEAEIAELHGISADIHSLSRLHTSINWQQSRSLWLKEGDANSKYFHSVLAGRRRGKTISVIQADGVTLEGVNTIPQAMFSHFV